jgi:hypothetical protein
LETKENAMSEAIGKSNLPAGNDFTAPSGNGFKVIGAATCFGMALMYIIATFVYLPAMQRGPSPISVMDWFQLLQTDPVAGLFYLGFADILIVILFAPTALALREALSHMNKTWATLATSLAFIGIAVYLATNASLAMLSLSSEHAAATTELEKSAIISAGHAIIGTARGSGNATGLGLIGLASLIFSILMIRSNKLGKTCEWIGVPSFALLVPGLFLVDTHGEYRRPSEA